MKIVYAFALFVSIFMGGSPVAGYSRDSFDFVIAKTPYRISLAATAGTLIGQAEEIVYNVKNYGDDTDIYFSQLLWDLKPLVYIGSSLSLSRADPFAGFGVTVDLSVKFGLPLPSGSMEDRDWQNPDPGQLTDFSTHDVYLEEGALLLDISGGITVPIASTFALTPLLAFSYMQFSWSGQDGYGTYIHTNPPWERQDFNGTIITYDQAWLILASGLGLFWSPHRILSVDFRFYSSPLIYAIDMDHHITTSTRYNDYMRGGWILEPALDIAFSPARFFSLVAHGSWRYIAGTRGDTYQSQDVQPDSLYRTPGGAGAGFSAFDVGVSFKFALPLGILGK